MKKPNKERLIVVRKVYDEKLNDFEIKLTDALSHITHLIVKYGEDANICNEYGDIFVEYKEFETDKEYDTRVKKEEERYNKNMEKKRKQLENLKKELDEK